ncbi:hypothetical protein STRAU_5183 [Streptomyces aurantiacus JA 4570]|uniref:Uncharacterized protein n=1 Tax=Streptomyces aurantiacus JA 4570 TaxID=1286094 RepID=S3ZGI0_9ACTN|nr:hypothetical protein STRAU_5183 [Streptomyces aurantiacus JA 4570]
MAPCLLTRERALSRALPSTPVVSAVVPPYQSSRRRTSQGNARPPSLRSTLHRKITQTLSKRDSSPQLRGLI